MRNERSARKEQSRLAVSPRKMCAEHSVSGVQHTSGEDLASSIKSPFGGAGG